ncbi:D-alanyl-D-alanine carboxypeptidase family protein [Paenibacillus lutimineralis]|uniref:D-alanyl-D-alanine carboxypeptidase n=1 Tax=Paenibacillus lutimineralis TaxID=2707005 RepID=A0A3S9UWT6_9BACL|nr:D-alanyl-D-alanine carboxypeptidase family protein [Paenibacillus lutimineralis]AZS14784.1 D-alanyl-D-alanine carboxypeptidase [Paenibacillus lutimineralis]
MRMTSKIRFISLLTSCLLLLYPLAVQAEKQDKPNSRQVPGNHAQAAALIDVTSGRVLYEHHGDDKLPIASLTKIMTAIVAIEHGRLSDKVKVGRAAYGKEGSSIYLHLGEEMTLENMLFGLMLRSGNDAATAIAEHVGGSEEGFVRLMNEKASLLGLNHSQFQNPHGLDAKNHYSSAIDLAKLTSYAMHNPDFKEIVKTQIKQAPNPNDPWDYKWINKNKMLRFYEGADGVKTGYTKIARRCLVSSATRNGQQLVVVTINDGDDWNDHRKLLDYGFDHFPLVEIIKRGQTLHSGIVAGTGFKYALTTEESREIGKKLVLQEENELSFGRRGELHILLDQQPIGKIPVYNRGSIPPIPKQSQQVYGSGSMRPDWFTSFQQALRSLLFLGD